MKSEIWIYGINSILTAVHSVPDNIREIWVTKADGNRRIRQLLDEARGAGIRCSSVDSLTIEREVGDVVHQNVIALFKVPTYLGEQALSGLCGSGDSPAFLLLDRVNDPRNFGACLRTAEACAVTAVVIPADRSAELTPAVIKTASGAVGRVPIVKVPNLARAIAHLQKSGVWVIGAAAEGAASYTEIDYRRPIAFILGAEDTGLRQLTAKACDHLVKIPMYGKIESLNVSNASAVLLYEMRRQRNLSNQ